MSRLRRKWLQCVALVVMGVSVSLSGSAAAADQYAPPPNVLDGRALVAALRAGGYVLYFRHGITDHSIDDTDRVNLTNCATQRPLSEAGRKQMRATGEAIKALGIRISAVFSSPFCRTKESARLGFGDNLTVIDDLRLGVDDDQATAKRRAQALRKMLATLPGVAGTNTVITSHTGNLQDAAGIWPEPEGVAIIFKPGGDGKFSFIATVLPAQWQTWMRAKTKSADR